MNSAIVHMVPEIEKEVELLLLDLLPGRTSLRQMSKLREKIVQLILSEWVEEDSK